MVRRFLSVCFFLFLPLCAMSIPCSAQQPHSKLAITDPADADEDFHLQGEYLGTICGESGCWRQVGLQVRALGDGQFAAVEYPGGLPGNGWWSGCKYALSGQRKSGVVQMARQHCLFVVTGDYAQVYSAGGQFLGQLPKVLRKSRTLDAPPPCGATVLFDGKTNAFKNGKVTQEGWLKWGTETIDAYQDFTLHVEFRLPYMPYARGQGRANSGVYLQSRYEVQVLDSFSLDGEFNECGALYRTKSPDVNMCFPPLRWQTYEIHLRAPRFAADGETKICDGQITVVHNGVPVHCNVLLANKTGAGKKEGPVPLPTKLQDHGNPVVFRNIWIVDRNPAASVMGQRVAVSKQATGFVAASVVGPALTTLNVR